MTEEAANQFRAVQVSSDNRMPHSSQAAARPHAAFLLKHTGARAEPKHLLGFMHLERVKNQRTKSSLHPRAQCSNATSPAAGTHINSQHQLFPAPCSALPRAHKVLLPPTLTYKPEPSPTLRAENKNQLPLGPALRQNERFVVNT